MTTELRVAYSEEVSPEKGIRGLVENYRSADKSSQLVLEKAATILAQTNDAPKVAQANRAVRLTVQIANEAFLQVTNAKSKNLEDVLTKLELWQECAIGADPSELELSPMDKLLCSVVEDISRLSMD